MVLHDIADEPLDSVEVGEICRVGRGGFAETPDSRFQLASREIDTRDPGPGPDECLSACEPDAALRTRDEGHAPIEPPRVEGGLRAHRTATTASTSTGMSNGRWGTPTDVRAARRSGP